MDDPALESLKLELTALRGEQQDALEAARRLRARGALPAEVEAAVLRADRLQARIDDLQHQAEAARGSGGVQPAPADAGPDWPESVLPGERSGEGSQDLFKHVQRDIRRKAGLPSVRKPGDRK
jgi:hypothetical protein